MNYTIGHPEQAEEDLHTVENLFDLEKIWVQILAVNYGIVVKNTLEKEYLKKRLQIITVLSFFIPNLDFTELSVNEAGFPTPIFQYDENGDAEISSTGQIDFYFELDENLDVQCK